MTQILTEDLVTLAEAAEEINNQLPHHSIARTTMWRWVRSGVYGRRLEAVRIGKNWFTSKQAITRFVAGDDPS